MKSRLTRLDPKSKILKDPAGRKVAHSAGSVSGLARRPLGALALTSGCGRVAPVRSGSARGARRGGGGAPEWPRRRVENGAQKGDGV